MTGSSSGGVLAVVPTLGERTDTLGAALASVRAQTGVETTLVVVVPPAAEEARRIAEHHRAVIVDDPRRGLSAAVNAGIAAATTEQYFSWIGDDDELVPGGLRALVDLIEETGAVVAFGACAYMDGDNRVFAVSRAGKWARRVLAWGPDLIPQPASITRLDALRDVGPFDESLRFVMDLDMFLRLRRKGSFASTPRTVAHYRWHPDALTVANRGVSIAEAEAVKRRHLSAPLRPVARLWEAPVRWAITVVSSRLSHRARQGAA